MFWSKDFHDLRDEPNTTDISKQIRLREMTLYAQSLLGLSFGPLVGDTITIKSFSFLPTAYQREYAILHLKGFHCILKYRFFFFYLFFVSHSMEE